MKKLWEEGDRERKRRRRKERKEVERFLHKQKGETRRMQSGNIIKDTNKRERERERERERDLYSCQDFEKGEKILGT